MATDLGDAGAIAGSTMAGAAAGSWAGPVGMAIGGFLGFLGGVSSNNAENMAEAMASLQVQREKIAAGISSEARETGLMLNALSVDRARRDFAQQAFLSSEAVTAGGAITGLMGSSIAKNAKASMGQQYASGLQFSMLSEQMGIEISELNQAALNKRLGILTPEEQAAKDEADRLAAEATAQAKADKIEQDRIDKKATQDNNNKKKEDKKNADRLDDANALQKANKEKDNTYVNHPPPNVGETEAKVSDNTAATSSSSGYMYGSG